ncbi:hypothetical protein JZ751_015428 [Albula glossodonta]|uniref:Uncharacterized protein n=1 Tax=Albula glossodonta TaxID=121402 RepID=A0A8T2N6Z1_9TELE|nr:hypothetical protein JZ751_015428 [Albula glossodonta]
MEAQGLRPSQVKGGVQGEVYEDREGLLPLVDSYDERAARPHPLPLLIGDHTPPNGRDHTETTPPTGETTQRPHPQRERPHPQREKPHRDHTPNGRDHTETTPPMEETTQRPHPSTGETTQRSHILPQWEKPHIDYSHESKSKPLHPPPPPPQHGSLAACPQNPIPSTHRTTVWSLCSTMSQHQCLNTISFTTGFWTDGLLGVSVLTLGLAGKRRWHCDCGCNWLDYSFRCKACGDCRASLVPVDFPEAMRRPVL